MIARKIALAVAGVAVAAACVPESNPGWDAPLEPIGPVMLEDAMVYLKPAFEEIIVVRPEIVDGVGSLHVERHETGQEPSRMVASADGTQLYVLNEGDGSLSVFDIATGGVERRDVVLESAYDRVTVDPEGDFLLLSHSGEMRSNLVVQNLNELGIVDLRGAELEARFLSLPTRAQNLVFAPPFEMDGAEQRLVAALAESEVTLVDLTTDSPIDQWRRVQLTLSQADSVRTPTEVVFDVANPNAVSAFVLTAEDDDVTEVVIQSGALTDSTRKFTVSINQLAAGQTPGRIAMLDLPQGRRLLALDRSSPRFTLMDVVSGESVTHSLPMSVAAQHMIPFYAEVPGEERLEKKVLVYSRNSQLVTIIRPEAIAVGGETPTLGLTVQAIRMSAAPSEIRMDGAGDATRAVALHAGGNDGFTILDLLTNTEIRLQGFSLSDLVFDSTQAYGIFGNSPHMVRVDLASGHPQVFELPARARAIHLSPDRDAVMVRHDGRGGRFTVLPVAEPTPENGTLYEHVFLEGALDRPADQD